MDGLVQLITDQVMKAMQIGGPVNGRNTSTVKDGGYASGISGGA